MGYWTEHHYDFRNIEQYSHTTHDWRGVAWETRNAINPNSSIKEKEEFSNTHYCYTLMAWVRPQASDNDKRPVDTKTGVFEPAWSSIFKDGNWGVEDGNKEVGGRVGVYEGNFFAMHKGTDYEYSDLLLSGDCKSDTNYHVCITLGGTPYIKTLKVYINGVLTSYRDYTSPTILEPKGPNRDLVFGKFFNGFMWDIRTFKKTLSQSEILNYMNNSPTSSEFNTNNMLLSMINGEFYMKGEVMPICTYFKSTEHLRQLVYYNGSSTYDPWYRPDMGDNMNSFVMEISAKNGASIVDVDFNHLDTYRDYTLTNGGEVNTRDVRYIGAFRAFNWDSYIKGTKPFKHEFNNHTYNTDINKWIYGKGGFTGYTINFYVSIDKLNYYNDPILVDNPDWGESYYPVSESMQNIVTMGGLRVDIIQDATLRLGVWDESNNMIYFKSLDGAVDERRWTFITIKCYPSKYNTSNFPIKWKFELYSDCILVCSSREISRNYAPGVPNGDVVFGADGKMKFSDFTYFTPPLTLSEMERYMYTRMHSTNDPHGISRGPMLWSYMNELINYDNTYVNAAYAYTPNGADFNFTDSNYGVFSSNPDQLDLDQYGAVKRVYSSSSPSKGIYNIEGIDIDDIIYVDRNINTTFFIHYVPIYCIDKGVVITSNDSSLIVNGVYTGYSHTYSMQNIPTRFALLGTVRGEYYITITSASNPYIVKIVKVVVGVRVTNIRFENDTELIYKGTPKRIKAFYTPQDATDYKLIWSSLSLPNLTVSDIEWGDNFGYTTALISVNNITNTEYGLIKCANYINTISDLCNITMAIPVESLIFSRHEIILQKDFTVNIPYEILPLTSTFKQVNFTYNENISIVDKGTSLDITGLHMGVTTLAGEIEGKTDECKITVIDSSITFYTEGMLRLNTANDILRYINYYNFIPGMPTFTKKIYFINTSLKNMKNVRIKPTTFDLGNNIGIEIGYSNPISPVGDIYVDTFMQDQVGAFYMRLTTTYATPTTVNGEFYVYANWEDL